jgi:hypothetical protein
LTPQNTAIAWSDDYPVLPTVFDGNGSMIAAAANYLISQQGAFSGGGIDNPDMNALERAKTSRWVFLKEARDEAEWGGTATNFGRFDTDEKSQGKLTGASLAALILMSQGQPFSKIWTREDNTSVTLTGSQLIEVGLTVMAWVDTVHQRSRVLYDRIQTATTVPEVDAVLWTLVDPPVNSVAPAITGTATEGQTLTVSTGTWSGSPTFSYVWRHDGTAISGATASTYTLVTGDIGTVITCSVTATNSGGFSSVITSATAIVSAQ